MIKPTQLMAGVARVEITDTQAGPVNDPLYVKALVLDDGATRVAIVTVDAVAIAEIGSIRNGFLGEVRSQLAAAPGIAPSHVLVNVSHCHGIVCADVEARTVQAVRQAAAAMVPVVLGVGAGREDRITENRRLRLRNGREADVRHAYSLPPDEDVAGVGPIDPEIGVLRLDRLDGRTLAVVYNFACHPIQGVPSGANTADITGFASSAVEDALGDGTTALFLQGCAGDVNPVWYKDVDHPRDGEPLGNMLGLSVLRAARRIRCRQAGPVQLISETIKLPLADLAPYIDGLRAEQARLLASLEGTSLNLKTFLHLATKYGLAREFPSYYSHRYLHDRALGRGDLDRLDAVNRQNMDRYIQNVHTMEQLTRVRTNLELLEAHQARYTTAADKTIEVELAGLRVGDFVLLSFPGELSAQIGLNIKAKSPHKPTFVAAYTNGYIYYAPTAEQLENRGWAQEDCDCMLAPEWQDVYEGRAAELLAKLR